ncbi:MAG TPA: hypothetical protein VK013_14605 [Myxococcaceae bacterium]|nr:hypothetical protein [Myxococcaceae bacterium]
MPNRLLVVHGPNVPLRLEKEAGLSLAALHRALNAVAKGAGVTLRFVHVHGDEGLLAELWTQRRSLQGVLWAPGSQGTPATIDEALQLLAVPVETLAGGTLDRAVYERALEALIGKMGTSRATSSKRAVAAATKSPGATKSIGRQRVSAAAPAKKDSGSGGVKKTLGRRRDAAAKPEAAGPPRTLGRVAGSRTRGEVEASHPTQSPRAGQGGVPTRAQTRERIAQRLSGAMTAAALAVWAQDGWTKAEAQQAPDTRLSAVLLSLMAAQRLSEDRLISLMTELDS